MVIGDFNAEILNNSTHTFSERYYLSGLIKELACCKNHYNVTCIDLILLIPNSACSFQNFNIVEICLSDFYTIIITVLKQHFKVSIKYYRNYSYSENDTLRECYSMTYQKQLIRKGIIGMIAYQS